MIGVALTIVLAVAAGVVAERRRPDRAGDVARRLLSLLLYALGPVAFFNIARLDITTDNGVGLSFGIVALLLAGACAWLVARWLLKVDRPRQGTMIMLAMQANTGQLGLPMALALLGTDGLGEAVAYNSIVQAPVLFVGVFGVGAAFGTLAGETFRERTRAFLVRNPPLIGVLLALVAPDALAPDIAVDTSRLVVFAMLPIGFLAVGVTMAEEATKASLAFPPPITRDLAAVLLLRLVVAPGLLIALAAAFIDLPESYALLAAMACGVNTLVVAHTYGLDQRLTASSIVWSTAIVVSVGVVASLVPYL